MTQDESNKRAVAPQMKSTAIREGGSEEAPLMLTTTYHTKIGLRKSKQYSKQPERKQLYMASS